MFPLSLPPPGSSGPSWEDAIGLFLTAFGLYGILQLFFRQGKQLPGKLIHRFTPTGPV